MAILAIDFDGVIHDPSKKGPGMRLGLPMPDAIESMQRLKARGHQLVVFTVRGDRPKHIMDWCHYHGIPFDDVTNIKRDADLYIDDKAITFTTWDKLSSLWA